MIDSASLLKDLKGRLKLLQADLKARADDPTNDWGARLKEEYDAALKRERTGHSWSVWRDNEVDQAAVAWIISTTFLRFCEDNNLLAGAELDGKPVAVGWISGPGDSVTRSEENLSAYFLEHPDHNRRHWLQQGFRVLAAQAAGSLLIDPDHNPVWTATISQDAAASLIDFWRTPDANGALVHDFTDHTLDTRFLGDLYQDLSDHAKKTYALLQTPVFVEEFILDQTLEPAVKEFGLDGFKMIDPTCGSGHFLLGAFTRLHQKWQAESPARGPKELVRKAMDSIHGVDLNPFAVAIARFRLTVAGLQAAGETSLVGVAPMGFHLAIGDSLLGEQGGSHAGEFDIFGTHDEPTFEYDGEDLSEYTGILTTGQYHAVVGNPPYITVKDKLLNQKYREAYKTTSGKYALSVPFMELFFRLAITGAPGQPAGFTGQITSNSFMKREFGKKLIEEFFAGFHTDNPVDLLQVIDSSGAWMPGHNFDGTPTVIIIGRRRRPVSNQLRVVLGVKDDPGKPQDPSCGPVWQEISQNFNNPGFTGEYVSVTDLDRNRLSKHPWSLSGGGANGLLDMLEKYSNRTPRNIAFRIGFFGIMGNDEAFTSTSDMIARIDEDEAYKPLVVGEFIRDYSAHKSVPTFFPYNEKHELQALDTYPKSAQRIWNLRTELGNRKTFSKQTYFKEGRNWFEWHQLPKDVRAHKWAIAYSVVATHNHFALDRDGTVFKQSAPVIKLPLGATEEQHFELLGLLNSSTACFWLKQVCQKRGGDADVPWLRTYEYSATKIQSFPMPDGLDLSRPRVIDSLAQDRRSTRPGAVIKTLRESLQFDLNRALESSEQKSKQLRKRMIFEQEELDWESYRLYGLISEDLTYSGAELNQIDAGQRAFEITLARQGTELKGGMSWFDRNCIAPILEVPENWPDEYKYLVQKRLELIASDPNIMLLESAEFKRPWVQDSWIEEKQTALKEAILSRVEDPALWKDPQGISLRTLSELTHALRNDEILHGLAAIYSGTANPELENVLRLVLEEAVPYVAAYRYASSGMEKFREWQAVWHLQRQEDTGQIVSIPVPPKFVPADFKSDVYWKARGKLDVPKERVISYPDLSKANDSTPVLGWAGWSYRDQALALARELPGRMALIPESGTDAVVPLLAGLVELEPWLEQWHQEIEPEFGMSPAAMITQVLDTALSGLAMTRDQVTAWTPPAPSRGRASKK